MNNNRPTIYGDLKCC